MKYNFNKKALSTVVTTLLTIALALFAIAIVWGITTGLIQKQISGAEKCNDLINKITINSKNTCYDEDLQSLQFSINIGEISVDDILVTITDQAGAKSFKFMDEEIEYNVKQFGDEFGNLLEVPEKNTGTTYVANLVGIGLSGAKPQSIKVAPIIKNEQCDQVDSLVEIPYCAPA